ncbi:MAG TPA: hypothetical protein VG897_19910 [Terriglobales bacterium]|nr:hypothetical protein [Terriglobales bacterium]
MSAVVFIQASEEVNQNVNLQPEPKAPESRSLVAICEHIKDNGFRCGTPAVKGRPFCYYHGRAHAHTPRIGERGYRAPLVETVESLQLIVTQITEALGAGRITDKTAGKLLYAVQISSHLLKMKKEALGAGAPFKPSVVLSGEVQNAALTSEPATEVSEAMEVALRSRPLLDPAAAAYPNVVSEDDPEMPTTIEEAKRALFSPQQFVDFYKTLNNCDRLTFRYSQLLRRLQFHRRAYKILVMHGLLGDEYQNAIANLPIDTRSGPYPMPELG